MMKLNAKQLRVSEPTEEELSKVKRRDIYIVCDNILDTYNIGSIFRLADAAGVKRIYLCGDSETPPNIKIQRSAVGTDKWVEWEYSASASEAIERLRRQFSTYLASSGQANSNNNSSVIATRQQAGKQSKKKILEPFGFAHGEQVQDDDEKIATGSSSPRNDGEIRIIAIEQGQGSVDYRTIEYSQPLALVVGHETTGVSEDTLRVCDAMVEIPMYGVNVSLNVMVSLAIVLFKSIEDIAED